MQRFSFVVALSALSACGVATQPESNETVAAYEVPLPIEAERKEFLNILSAVAESEGLHVDSAAPDELRHTGEMMPSAKMSIHAAVWRGSGDDESEAVILDLGHLGQAWIMFSKGKDPALASSFRIKAMKRIKERWPDTLSLPIIDNRSIPLPEDLIRTPDGYKLNADANFKYTNSQSAPNRIP